MDDTSPLRRLTATLLTALALVAAPLATVAHAAPTVSATRAAAVAADPRVTEDAWLDPARAVLRANRPLTISVMCDSVGNDPGEWVSKWAADLAGDRVVSVHQFDWQRRRWSPTVEVYGPDADPARPPVTVWNFGWPGGTPLRAAENLTVGVPSKPDLTIVSFGHNLGPATVVPQYTRLEAAMRARFGAVPTVTTLAHMTPIVRPGQAEGRVLLLRWLRAGHRPYIDERGVFDGVADESTVFYDAIHPNWLGYRLISDLVGDALRGRRSPASTFSTDGAGLRLAATSTSTTRSNRTTTVRFTYVARGGDGRPLAHAWVVVRLGPSSLSLETDRRGQVSGSISAPRADTTLTATATDGFGTATATPAGVRG